MGEKSRKKIIKAYETGLKTAEFENIDAATYKWFLSKRCEYVPTTRLIVQTETLKFARKLKMDGSEIGRKGKPAIISDLCPKSRIGKLL